MWKTIFWSVFGFGTLISDIIKTGIRNITMQSTMIRVMKTLMRMHYLIELIRNIGILERMIL